MKQTRIRLKNGIKLLHYYLPATNSATICAMFKVGAVNEKRKEYGLAHFLEHMIFEGSKNFPEAQKTNEMIETLGIVENAWTSKNITNYWAKSSIKNFSKAVKVTFDRVFNPLFKTDSIVKQKGIILEEINMGDDDPLKANWKNLSKYIFKATPLAHPTIGYKKTVSNFTPDLISKFHKKYYARNNMIVWIGGNIPFEEAANLVEKIPIPKTQTKKYGKKFKDWVKNSSVFKRMDIKQNHIFVGISGFDISNPDIEHAQIANTILGIGKGSLLNYELKTRKPLVSLVESELDSFKNNGLIVSLAVTSDKYTIKVVEIMLEQLKRLVNGDYSQELLVRAKNLVKSEFLALEETSSGFGYTELLYNLMRRELLSGRKIDFGEVIDKINRAKKQDVTKTIQNLVEKGSIVISIVGPDPKVKEKVEKVLNKFSLK